MGQIVRPSKPLPSKSVKLSFGAAWLVEMDAFHAVRLLLFRDGEAKKEPYTSERAYGVMF